jgi:hypothetical protein
MSSFNAPKRRPGAVAPTGLTACIFSVCGGQRAEIKVTMNMNQYIYCKTAQNS